MSPRNLRCPLLNFSAGQELRDIRHRGHPLGRVSRGKKVFVPNSFIGLVAPRSGLLLHSIRTCYFVRLIPDHRPPQGGGDPFSHPSGSSVERRQVRTNPLSNRKELNRSPVPSGSFSCPPMEYPLCRTWSSGHRSVAVSSLPVHDFFSPALARPTRDGESRKPSVPVRVHSSAKSSGSADTGVGVQPVCDSRHGRIACKKLFPKQFRI